MDVREEEMMGFRLDEGDGIYMFDCMYVDVTKIVLAIDGFAPLCLVMLIL